MQIFNGRDEAHKLDEKIKELIATDSNVQECVKKQLAIIQIGENSESQKYVNLKEKIGKKLGIDVGVYKFSEKLNDLELVNACTHVFEDTYTGGVIVQLPLPRETLDSVLSKIPVEKDIDSLAEMDTLKSDTARLQRNSPVVRSAEHFIYSIQNANDNKTALIIGGGKLVGLPIANFLENNGWEVEIDENYYEGKPLNANLIVLSAGIPNLVNPKDISKGANVIDFGSSVVNGETVGDLNMESLDEGKLDHLGLISPSPGGMGPLVVRYLFLNFLGK